MQYSGHSSTTHSSAGISLGGIPCVSENPNFPFEYSEMFCFTSDTCFLSVSAFITQDLETG